MVPLVSKVKIIESAVELAVPTAVALNAGAA